GKPVSTTPVTANVQVVNDGSSNPTWACFPLVEPVTGKVALIDRRSCEFGEKALNAQKAGAVACIICNYQEGTISMGPGAMGGQVTIPVVMMQKSDCDLLRQYAGPGGLNVSIGLDATVSGPNYLDGDFDNGIIAHEYGHGISNRLTGFNASCLGNAEQMGEGWSDFFTLVTTVRPSDKGADRQGVGTFVLSQANDGTGIRRYPYSTNMSINPVTYSTVAENTEIHALGEVWTAMLWDLYWAMADRYGFDANLNNTSSGNGRALQLVMDGMKLQPCNPGFQDGRNAILMADKIRYGGADTCLISSVFARRGLGYSANQGLATNASDGIEDFDPIPYCVKNLKISKTTSNPTITAGEEVNFSIKVSNHKDETAAAVRVTDELPAGLTFISASDGGKLENGYIVWELGDMPTLSTKTLTYKAKSASNIGCDVYYNDDMEVPDDWYASFVKGSQVFELQSGVVKTGTQAWLGQGASSVTEFLLEGQVPFTVQGSRPHLRFWHQYNTEIGVDAGFLEVQQEGIAGWTALTASSSVRHPYAAKIPYSTFALPFLSGFSGNSKGWVQSYFDLSAYAGKKIAIRFHFGTNADGASSGALIAKWYIDDVEQVDLVNFDGQACVTYQGGSPACARAPERGVIVNRGTSATDDPSQPTLPIHVQPNPASDLLNITLGEAASGAVQVTLLSAEGRQVATLQREQYATAQVLSMDVSRVPAGMYWVRVQTASGVGVEKVVVKR
ncbi:MAG TPA: M36 family metallopeptidase, partial [Saprospiraceae bacterium]|nr:M36 family metallopeptidase [Saprospiraceae bacterium]